jgi:hypothetical protein
MAYKSLSVFTFSIKWFTIPTATQTSHWLSLWASYYINACFIQNPSCFTSDDGPQFFMFNFGDVFKFPLSLSFPFYDVDNDSKGPTQAFCFFGYQRRIISPHLLTVSLKFFSTLQQIYFLPQKQSCLRILRHYLYCLCTCIYTYIYIYLFIFISI